MSEKLVSFTARGRDRDSAHSWRFFEVMTDEKGWRPVRFFLSILQIKAIASYSLKPPSTTRQGQATRRCGMDTNTAVIKRLEERVRLVKLVTNVHESLVARFILFFQE